MSTIDITAICLSIIGICTVLITIKVIPWFKQKVAKEKFELFLQCAEICVKSAEQMFAEDQGGTKKLYVVDRMNSILSELGMKIDEKLVSDAIESSVLQIHNSLYWEDYNSEINTIND